ncbi:MAG: SRPBCC family protein [Myxococcota bacterium]|nr:SRPBCC family protein [Myxococcota bacterium]
MIHRLYRRTELPLPRSEVFRFFADAGNLQRITPPELAFEFVTPLPIEMRVGALIDYRLQLFGVRFGWRTEITAWQPEASFVDEQVRGPYRSWVHTHRFREVPGGTEVEDEVDWSLPLPPFGEVARPIVRRQLERIFDHRERTIRALLLGTPG